MLKMAYKVGNKPRKESNMNWELKQKIVEKCGSQVDFAHLVKCNETLVSKVVRGRRTLDPDKQIIWAEALHSTPRELFGRDQT